MESSFFCPLDKRPPGDLSPWSLRSRGLRSSGKATVPTCCSHFLLDSSQPAFSLSFRRIPLALSPLFLLPSHNSILPEPLYTNTGCRCRLAQFFPSRVDVLRGAWRSSRQVLCHTNEYAFSARMKERAARPHPFSLDAVPATRRKATRPPASTMPPI